MAGQTSKGLSDVNEKLCRICVPQPGPVNTSILEVGSFPTSPLFGRHLIQFLAKSAAAFFLA